MIVHLLFNISMQMSSQSTTKSRKLGKIGSTLIRKRRKQIKGKVGRDHPGKTEANMEENTVLKFTSTAELMDRQL